MFDRHFWCRSAFCLRVSVIFPTCSLYPQQKRAYSALHPQAWTYIYIYTAPRPKALTECSPLDFRRSSIAWLPVFRFLTCAQMLMHAIAHGDCTDSVTESALEVDSGRKILCHTVSVLRLAFQLDALPTELRLFPPQPASTPMAIHCTCSAEE